ncbi:hypothetical protein C8R46DRAFT_1026835 [Mycena filopes]|nr:hypothetical protein C8R46DRAFT_1026835 [Mycena filopes]
MTARMFSDVFYHQCRLGVKEMKRLVEVVTFHFGPTQKLGIIMKHYYSHTETLEFEMLLTAKSAPKISGFTAHHFYTTARRMDVQNASLARIEGAAKRISRYLEIAHELSTITGSSALEATLQSYLKGVASVKDLESDSLLAVENKLRTIPPFSNPQLNEIWRSENESKQKRLHIWGNSNYCHNIIAQAVFGQYGTPSASQALIEIVVERGYSVLDFKNSPNPVEMPDCLRQIRNTTGVSLLRCPPRWLHQLTELVKLNPHILDVQMDENISDSDLPAALRKNLQTWCAATPITDMSNTLFSFRYPARSKVDKTGIRLMQAPGVLFVKTTQGGMLPIHIWHKLEDVKVIWWRLGAAAEPSVLNIQKQVEFSHTSFVVDLPAAGLYQIHIAFHQSRPAQTTIGHLGRIWVSALIPSPLGPGLELFSSEKCQGTPAVFAISTDLTLPVFDFAYASDGGDLPRFLHYLDGNSAVSLLRCPNRWITQLISLAKANSHILDIQLESGETVDRGLLETLQDNRDEWAQHAPIPDEDPAVFWFLLPPNSLLVDQGVQILGGLCCIFLHTTRGLRLNLELRHRFQGGQIEWWLLGNSQHGVMDPCAPMTGIVVDIPSAGIHQVHLLFRGPEDPKTPLGLLHDRGPGFFSSRIWELETAIFPGLVSSVDHAGSQIFDFGHCCNAEDYWLPQFLYHNRNTHGISLLRCPKQWLPQLTDLALENPDILDIQLTPGSDSANLELLAALQMNRESWCAISSIPVGAAISSWFCFPDGSVLDEAGGVPLLVGTSALFVKTKEAGALTINLWNQGEGGELRWWRVILKIKGGPDGFQRTSFLVQLPFPGSHTVHISFNSRGAPRALGPTFFPTSRRIVSKGDTENLAVPAWPIRSPPQIKQIGGSPETEQEVESPETEQEVESPETEQEVESPETGQIVERRLLIPGSGPMGWFGPRSPISGF